MGVMVRPGRGGRNNNRNRRNNNNNNRNRRNAANRNATPRNNNQSFGDRAERVGRQAVNKFMNTPFKDAIHPAYINATQSVQRKVSGAVIGLLTSIPKALFKVLNTLFVRTFNINRKKAGSYISNGSFVIKFPILATESIDQSIVSKFCAMLQTEKAENIRIFFYNHDLTLGYANHNLAKEFDPGFYKEHEENSESGEMLSELVFSKDRLSKKVDGNSSTFKNPYEGKALKLPTKDLMPIAPVIVTVGTNSFLGDEYNEQILGIRYIPHRIPFNEIKVAFKFGTLNSRVLMRLIKLFKGDLTFGDWLSDRDKKALNYAMTKIAVGDKSWNKALKDSSHAVTMIMSKEEFDNLNESVTDLSKPANFKNFQKDIGLLDLIVIDRNAQEFLRINSADNYQPIRHDMREALNSYSKDIVINTKIEASNFHDEDVI